MQDDGGFWSTVGFGLMCLGMLALGVWQVMAVSEPPGLSPPVVEVEAAPGEPEPRWCREWCP